MKNHSKTINIISMMLTDACYYHKDDETELRNIKLFEHKNNIWHLMIWKTDVPKHILHILEHASQYAAFNGLAPEEQPIWQDYAQKMGFKFEFIAEVKAAPIKDSDDEEYIIDHNMRIINISENQFEILADISDNYPQLLDPILAFNEKQTLNTIVKQIAEKFVSDHETAPSELDYSLDVINDALAAYNCVHMKEDDKAFVIKSELEEKT